MSQLVRGRHKNDAVPSPARYDWLETVEDAQVFHPADPLCCTGPVPLRRLVTAHRVLPSRLPAPGTAVVEHDWIGIVTTSPSTFRLSGPSTRLRSGTRPQPEVLLRIGRPKPERLPPELSRTAAHRGAEGRDDALVPVRDAGDGADGDDVLAVDGEPDDRRRALNVPPVLVVPLTGTCRALPDLSLAAAGNVATVPNSTPLSPTAVVRLSFGPVTVGHRSPCLQPAVVRVANREQAREVPSIARPDDRTGAIRCRNILLEIPERGTDARACNKSPHVRRVRFVNSGSAVRSLIASSQQLPPGEC